MTISTGYRSERLFAELCKRQFLQGFVFHSPRFNNPTEQEAGDIVLWVRRKVIVIELLTRDSETGSSTKQFVKRIGEKRKQLVRDHKVFRDPTIDIRLINEQGEKVDFIERGFEQFGFAGIVVLDCDDSLEKPHFESLAKTLSLQFPVSVMTMRDFLDLMSEIDTVPDLFYYLNDRTSFLKSVYAEQAHLFLDLNNRLERNLISFYKLNLNQFTLSEWRVEKALTYYHRYHLEFRDKIAARNEENTHSYLIDNLIEILRSRNTSENSTLLHSWELASMTRRQRASGLSRKIGDAITRMLAGNERRYFAFFNQTTGCWLVFFFQYGGERRTFIEHAQKLVAYKLLVEIRKSDFRFSVFGYAFRKSEIETGSTFDDVFLAIQDASNVELIKDDDLERALNFFGGNAAQTIREFPS